MRLSVQQRSELSMMDQTLSGDATLRAIADLFPLPAPPSGDRPTAPRAGGIAHRKHGIACGRAGLFWIAVAFMLAGLILTATTAPLGMPWLTGGGIASLICGACLVVGSATGRRRGARPANAAEREPDVDHAVCTPTETDQP